ncbi:hypothetical protein BDN72DRAFT_905577 [Pluteus cervinus]|uniref:Uncharacterized protein n=1 Tax=Pluteus cervinus TaxID=181527 RepID=A0ACD3A2C9_9AGAR|nr:hypothetical protein BDN72DRAFT_905577 [Pluteus cervinus]
MDEVHSSTGFCELPWSVEPRQWITGGHAKNLHDGLLKFQQQDHTGSLEKEHLWWIFKVDGGISHSTSSKVACYATHVVWAYRLLDELSVLALSCEHLPTGTSVPKPFDQPFKYYNSHMKDWFALMKRSEDVRRSYQQKSPSLSNSDDRKAVLANCLNLWRKTSGWASILCNWAGAALHLCLILEGKHPVTYVEREVRESLSGYVQDLSPANFKNPLHLSLAVSPLCLFSTVELSGRAVNQGVLLSAWTNLGSSRPLQLRKVERILWNALIEIATRNTDLEKRVGKALDDVLALGLEGEDERLRSWFLAKEPLPVGAVEGGKIQAQVGSQQESAIAKPMNVDQSPPPYSLQEDIGDNNRSLRNLAKCVGETPPQDDGMDVDDVVVDKRGESAGDKSAIPRGLDEDDVDMDAEEHPHEQGRNQDTSPQDSEGDSRNKRPITRSKGVGGGVNAGSAESGKENRARTSSSTRPAPSESAQQLRKKRLRPAPNPLPKAKAEMLNKRQKTGLTLDNDGIEEIPADQWFGDLGPQALLLNSLQQFKVKEKVEGDTIYLIDLNNEEYSWVPFMHFIYQSEWIPKMIGRAKGTYVEKMKKKKKEKGGNENGNGGGGGIEGEHEGEGEGEGEDKGKDKGEGGQASNQKDQKDQKDMIPRYLGESSDKERSAFCVLSADEFRNAGPGLSSIFKKQHLVIRNRMPPTELFGEEALAEITILDKPLWIHGIPYFYHLDFSSNSFQDLSIRLAENSPNVRTVRGTARHLIEAHKIGATTGKSLNCLALRMPRGEAPCRELSTDGHAFTTTDTMWTTDGRGHPYPSDAMTWGLAATPGAHHLWHIDVSGLATRILVKSGVKLWFVAHPKPGKDFASVDFFNTSELEKCSADWEVEVVVLRAGDELYMRPNTPHAVITTESSICHGGYLICHTTIRDTCYGLFHCASHGHILTNIEAFPEALFLLRRIMMYWHNVVPAGKPTPHQPDPRTMEGLLDILTVCMLTELGELFDERFWNGTLGERDRIEMIEARRLSRSLVSWLDRNLKVEKTGARPVKVERDIYYGFLAHHLLAFRSALLKHADSRTEADLWSHEDLRTFLEKVYSDSRYEPFWNIWKAGGKVKSYSSNIWMTFKVKRMTLEPIKFDRNISGLTPQDVEWAKSHNIDVKTFIPHEYRAAAAPTRSR